MRNMERRSGYNSNNNEVRTISEVPITRAVVPGKVGTSRTGVSSGRTPVIKKLSNVELQERRDKGLCFSCLERFEPGHLCQRLFLIDCRDVEEEMAMEENILEAELLSQELRYLFGHYKEIHHQTQ